MVNLRWFRRHQKVMLVVFGVVLMAVFVLGSVIDYIMGSGGGGRDANSDRNTKVVQWDGGSFSRGELERLKHLHFAYIRFQDQLMAFAQRNRDYRGPATRGIDPIADRGDGAASAESDRAIFQRFALAEYARQKMDMSLGKDAVLEYFFLLTDQALSDDQIFSINNAANGTNVDYRDIIEYVKLELMARRVDEMLGVSLPFAGLQRGFDGSIADQFLSYVQTEKRFECSVLELKVDDYLNKVGEQPSNAQLREIYEKGKYNDRTFVTDRPAFKKPRQMEVEYLQADRTAFVERLMESVTKEEVIAEYDKLVAAKDPLVMEDVPTEEPLKEGESLEDPAPAPGDDSGEQPPADSDPAPMPEDDGGDGAESSGVQGETTEAGDDGEPAPTTDSTETPADSSDDNSESTDEGTGDGSGDGGVSSTFSEQQQWVSIPARGHRQDEAPSDPAPAPQDENPPSETPENTDDASVPQENPGETNPQESNQEGDPAVSDDPAAAPAETGEAMPQDDAPANDPLQVPVREQRPKKLDEALERSIKMRMKSAAANEAFRQALESARIELTDYQIDLADYEATQDLPVDERSEKPADLNLGAIADKYHLTFGTTGLVTFNEMSELPFGSARSFLTNQQGPVLVQACEVIFSNFDSTELFVPEIYGDSYVYRVIQKVDTRIPSFEEVRSEVEEYWRRQKAFDLARADAQKIIDSVKSSGKSLMENYPEKAKQTGEFAWFSNSFPLGVENPSDEFYAVAFELKQDELGWAPNSEDNAVFVVQKVKEDPRSMEALRDQFLKHLARFKQSPPNGVMSTYSQQVAQKYVAHIIDELGVQWLAH